MDIQELFNNATDAARNHRMKTSNQLTLRELIFLISNLEKKSLPIKFKGTEFFPLNCDSWRGSYSELAVSYVEVPPISTEDFLKRLKLCVGKKFQGYKGGEFLMGNNTPIWVANYGSSAGYSGNTMAIIGVEECERENLILAEDYDY